MSDSPAKPRLVFRVGFAGLRKLDSSEGQTLSAVLLQVFPCIAGRLAVIAPGIQVEVEKEPPVSRFYNKDDQKTPVLRLITGLCEGADAIAAKAFEEVPVPSEKGSDGDMQPHFKKEWAGVLPFDLETYLISRPGECRKSIRELAENCEWILELDGIYEEPRADGMTSQKRSAAYRAQSAFMLRQSDILIAAADPDVRGSAGGTLESVRNALAFELPVIFINVKTGNVHLISPEEDMFVALAAPPLSGDELVKKLKDWVNHLTADPDSPYLPPEQGDHHGKQFAGDYLLTEYFDVPPDQEGQPVKRRFEAVRQLKLAMIARIDGLLERLRAQAWIFFKRLLPVVRDGKKDVSIESIEPYRKRASNLSAYYNGQYRGAFVLNYFLAVVTVILATLSLVLICSGSHESAKPVAAENFPPAQATSATHPAADIVVTEHAPAAASPEHAPSAESHRLKAILLLLALTKILILGIISRNTRQAKNKQWNERAIAYRYLAERLRAMPYLMRLGSNQPPSAAPAQFDFRVARQSSIDWLFDTIVRTTTPLNSFTPEAGQSKPHRVAVQTLSALESIRTDWVKNQVIYHENAVGQMGGMHDATEFLSRKLAITVIVVVVIDLVLILVEIFDGIPRSLEALTVWSALLLVILSAVFPAIIAALGGLRFQSECQRLAERSAVVRVIMGGRTPEEKPVHSQHGGVINRIRRFLNSLVHPLVVYTRKITRNSIDFGEIEISGGRHAQLGAMIERITEEHSKGITIGSDANVALRLTESIAVDFNHEVAEWTVLYAKELSDPG